MPTRRFKYRSFLNIKVDNLTVNESVLIDLNTRAKLSFEQLQNLQNLPLTTTFNNIPFGNATSSNTTDIIDNNSELIPTGTAVFNKLNDFKNLYDRQIQQYQIPEFMLILPPCQLETYSSSSSSVARNLIAELYATSTGNFNTYLKSVTFKLVYHNSSIDRQADIQFISFSDSKFYSVEQLSSVAVGTRTILTFKITENFTNIYLKRSYTDLHLCTLNFKIISVNTYNPIIIETIQISELIDGDNINYLSNIFNEDVDKIDYLNSQNVKVCLIKSYNNIISTSNGQISMYGYVKKSTLTTGAYGFGVNQVGILPDTKEIVLSTN